MTLHRRTRHLPLPGRLSGRVSALVARARSWTALGLLALTVIATAPTAALAAETDVDAVRTATVRLIGLLVEQGVITKEKGDALLKELTPPPVATAAAAPAGAPAPRSAASAPGTVRVPYVPEFVKKEIKEEVRAELAAEAAREGWAAPGSVPPWVRGLEWDGDMRVRFQADRFADGNAPAVDVSATNRNRSLTLLNTTEDRERFRVRARAGLTATLDEYWGAGIRLSTGNSTDPVSANQTLGNYEQRYTVALDRAYGRLRLGEDGSVIAGRFGNPWYSTDLVWANDLSFDGIAGQWTPRLSANARGYLTVGILPIQEVELSSSDKWLFAGQVGATFVGTAHDLGGRVGLAYYHYKNIVGQLSPTGSSINEFTAPAFAQKGNTYYNISSDPARPLLGLAADYHLVNLTGQVDFPGPGGKRVAIVGDYVRNLAFNRSEVSQRVGSDVEPKVTGYHVRVTFGDPEVRMRHNWQVFMAYKHVERDAVLDAFTDSDFHLGGTDARGYILGGSYGLGKNTAASLRIYSADAISGPPLSVDVIQLDLNLRF